MSDKSSNQGPSLGPGRAPVANAVSAHSVVHTSVSTLSSPSGRGTHIQGLAKSHAGAEFVHGAIAAFCNIILTFPLNKLISRQAYEGLSARDALSSMKADQRQYGLVGVYRGVLPPLMQRSVSMGTMYSMYDFWFAQLNWFAYGAEGDGRLATDIPNDVPGIWKIKAEAAVIAGVVEALLTPFERVQTLLQHRRYTEVFTSTWDATRAVSRHGYKEFYRGFTAVVARNAPANAMFFTLRDPARDLIPAQRPEVWKMQEHSTLPTLRHANDDHAWQVFRDFVSGAGLGAAISTIVYPVTTLKNVMQLDIGSYHKSMVEVLRQVVRERDGPAGLYKGVSGNAARALISWGVANSAYEVAKKYVAVQDHTAQ